MVRACLPQAGVINLSCEIYLYLKFELRNLSFPLYIHLAFELWNLEFSHSPFNASA